MPLYGRTGGVKLHTSCDPNAYAGVKANIAIEDAAQLVAATLIAGASPDQAPFNYLFNPRDASTVGAVFNAIQVSIDEGNGSTTWVWCRDYTAKKICEGRTNAGIGSANVPGPDGVDTSILMCPKALALSHLLAPCKYRFSIYSIGVILLEGLLRIQALVKKGLKDGPFRPRDCHALLNGKGDPTTNIDSYTLLALWSYHLGLGGRHPDSNNCVKQLGSSFPEKEVVILDDVNAEKLDRSTWGVMARTEGLEYLGMVDGRRVGTFPPATNRPA
ncbi:MAG: hypothetical protein M1836_006000 [Candelina mexicana]|nr:MAG: hypothetical protein M1836_006000 [Candelina mexicana]